MQCRLNSFADNSELSPKAHFRHMSPFVLLTVMTMAFLSLQWEKINADS